MEIQQFSLHDTVRNDSRRKYLDKWH